MADLPVLHVPAADGAHMLHEQLGVDLARIVQEAEIVERHAQALRVVLEHRLERGDLELDLGSGRAAWSCRSR